MIALLTVAFTVSALTYFATFKLPRKWRILAAVTAFILLGVAPLTYILIVGDQMPADARLVTEEELKRAAETAP